MYFKLDIKEKKEEFYNYTKEYLQLKEALKLEKLIFIIGVRRVGKTSLMNILYHEIKGTKLWIDGRIIEKPKTDILYLIYHTILNKKSNIFGKITSLNFSYYGTSITFKKPEKTILEMEEKVRKKGTIYVFIDEAQKMPIEDLSNVLSYFYDRLPNVKFIISGSEIGLIEKVIGENDVEHPLFGRHFVKIIMNRLQPNQSFDYLKEGFKQVKVKVSDNYLLKIIDKLDGLIGWLTLFGYEYGILKNENALKKTEELATSIVTKELHSFLKNKKRKDLYIAILKEANNVEWSELHAYVNNALSTHIDESTFDEALKKLIDYSFLEKKDNKYLRADPLILKAVFRL